MMHLNIKNSCFVICVILVAFVAFSFTGCTSTSTKTNDSENLLKAVVEEVNKSCPSQFDNGLTAEKVELENNNVVYYFTMDPEIYDMETVIEKKEALRNAMLNGIKEMYANDAGYKRLIDFIVECNKDLIYRFTDPDTDESIDFVYDKATLTAL